MTIRVGLIGLNYGAQVHLPTFKAHPKYEVVAVCARTEEHAKAIAREHHIARWFTDPRVMMQAREIDLISLATPPGTHAGLAAMALGAGKHVAVEVGFVCEAADARVLAALARERGRVGAVAYVLRYSPLIRQVSDLLQQNALGALRMMRFESFSSFLIKTDPKYRWMWESKNGGGILLNFTAHGLDLARRWLGAAQEAEGMLKTFTPITLPLGTGPVADDSGIANLHFENGALASFNHSAVVAYPRTRIELHGAQASLLIDGLGEEASLIRVGESEAEPVYAPPQYLEESLGELGLPGGFRVFLDRLAAAIETGNAPADLATFADGWETARLIDAVKLASREKRRVKLTEIEAGWQVR